jgi:protein-S-isoprenylcysteine O-methyltransferase Ste14
MTLVRRLILGLLATGLDAALIGAALGGAAPLLAHRPAIALLAVWAAGSVFLAMRRPVRGHDAVTIERDTSGVLPALFALPLLAAPLAALGERLELWPLPGGSWVQWLGVAVSGAGIALRIAAMAQLGTRFSPLVALQREHPLETTGLYARVRHPGYVGAWLAALGGALAFDSALGLPAPAIMAALLSLRATREEALLERHFGEDYRRYRARTGRFFPRWIPAASSRAEGRGPANHG